MTPKQEIFAREYLIDLNATQAAIRAGRERVSLRRMGPSWGFHAKTGLRELPQRVTELVF